MRVPCGEPEIIIMDARTELCRVTVIVYSARDLQAHKKGDVCHASVVFGHGKDFYTTEVVESTTPEWNQEASFSISSHFQEPIKFKIKDKEHTLGSVSVPVPGLPTSPNKQWLPLQPHKRASEAHGSLQVGCWVSSSGSGEKVSDQIPSTSSHGTFDRSTLPRLHSNRHSMYDSTSSAGEKETGMRSYQSDDNVRERGVKEKEEEQVPEVTGVSPNEGPVQGGQRVVLRGSYLGDSQHDVVQVLVAGVDCTSSLEYFSPSKLAVVASSRAAPGSGPVVVHTRSGGVGVSWINFSYTVVRDNKPPKNETANSTILTELSSYKQQVKELKDRNKTLSEENEQLHGYIDRLLVGVLAHSPGVLEVPSTADSLRHNLTQ